MQKIHFFENIFRSMKISSLKILEISENPNIFEKSKMFEMFEIFEPNIFVDRKILFEKLFVYFFVKYMNVAFQQAIGHLQTPSGRGERAI